MDLPTPGTTKPLLTRDPIGTEAEMTPGPDDETPYDAAENRRDWQAFRRTQAGQAVPDLDAPDFADGDRDDREDGLPDSKDGRELLETITGDNGGGPPLW